MSASADTTARASDAVSPVRGTCAAAFKEVRAEFERNFAERSELGASVCVRVGGEVVVDLWGGIADPTSARPWERDTVGVIMSCTKGVSALCANILVDRGELDPWKPVAHYWPEFGASGKEMITVRTAFSHQSGVYAFGVPVGEAELGIADWERCVHAIEQTQPFHAPGTSCAYHGFTLGFLIGEVLRRIDGRTIGTFLREDVCEPLGLDLWIGIPPEVEQRIAPSIPFDPSQLPPEALAAMMDPTQPLGRLFANTGGWLANWDDPRLHAAELPAMGGVGNARSLSGLYAPLSLDGSLGDVRLVSADALTTMRTPLAVTDCDLVLGHPAAYTLGFAKSWPIRLPGGGSTGVVIGEDAFGTPGMGGNMGFADPSYELAFGYTMNRHGLGTALNERGQSLIDATYRALGAQDSASGFWRRPRTGPSR